MIRYTGVNLSLDRDLVESLETWRALAGDTGRSATLRRVVRFVERRPDLLYAALDRPDLLNMPQT